MVTKENVVHEESYEDDEEMYENSKVYVVDPLLGPYKTIAAAIEAADQHSIIKIAGGLYTENIIIKGKSLRLEPKDKISSVIIVVNGGPSIYIENEITQKVIIQN